jgi:DNA-binding XRE family transcriptional regulator
VSQQERNTMPSRISTPSKRFVAAALTPEEKRKVRQRAAEWKRFRRDYLFTQKALADALPCSVRTVASIESGKEVASPSLDLLRSFRDLRRKEEMKRKQYELAVAS